MIEKSNEGHVEPTTPSCAWHTFILRRARHRHSTGRFEPSVN